MLNYLLFSISVISSILIIIEADTDSLIGVEPTRTFMFWPNGTIPFYINPNHFDHEQALAIMRALSMFTFKSCLKFAPVMAAPEGNQHVMVFENPGALRRCKIVTTGHSPFEPHSVILGYECLQSPQIDMIIMKALGFPFEHNRASRDVYIEVLVENIEPGSIELFAKEALLPLQLRNLPYDINSVMHFGERDFSKNGHRTIIFKDRNVQQNRVGLSPIDIRKIEIVYGPECRKRDRQEKIELCQSYPGVARKKRQADFELKSLRVNPDITPPQHIENDVITEANTNKETRERFIDSLKKLGIEDEVQVLLEHVYKVSALAVKNARHMYCNTTQNESRTAEEDKKENSTDILGVIEVVADYAKSVVDNAVSNLTIFCEASEDVEKYQRYGCRWNDNSERCRQTYRSTKSGPVKYSTQHRPIYIQSTKHDGVGKRIQYVRMRHSNNSETTEAVGTERDAIVKTNANVDVTHQSSIKTDVGTENLKSKVQKRVVSNDKVAAVDNIETRKEKDTNMKTAEHSRKKREAAETVTTDREIMVLNSSESVQEYVDVFKENITENPSDVTTTPSGFAKVQFEEKKVFKNRRFKEKQSKGKGNKDWDESSMSLERKKGVDKKQVKIHHRHKENNEMIDIGVENNKRKEESHKQSLSKKRLVKERARAEPKKKLRTFAPRTVALSKLNREFYDERKWPNGIVKYVIAENSLYDIQDLRHRIAEVNAILRRKTCVTLMELTEDQAKDHEDYLVIDTSPDYVTGRVGGRQNFGSIELYRGGQHRQHTAMMVMAMLGFYFEVARHDRDKHIRVHMRHVRPDKLHHFEKIREEATLPVPYDYKSATHPAWQFWRKIGKTGISTVATYKEHDADGSLMRSLGQNEELLSDTDIVKINSVYGVKCFQKTKNRSRKPIDKDERSE